MRKTNVCLLLFALPFIILAFVSSFACKKTTNPTFAEILSGPTPTGSAACTFITQWTGSSSVTLNNPHGISADENDNVYVASYGNRTIQVFNSSGSSVTQWTVGYQPEGVGVNNSVDAYVADQYGDSVYRYTKDGMFIGTTSVNPEGISCIASITIDPLATPSVPVTTYTTGTWNFNGPMGVAFDASGNLYNTSFWTLTGDCGHRYYAHLWKNTNGSGIWSIIWRSSVSGTTNPIFVAVNQLGSYAYIADSSANHVYCIDTSSADPTTYVYRTPDVDSTTGGAAVTQFNAPHGIAVDRLGYVFVADTGNNRIKVYASDLSGPLTVFGVQGSKVREFNNPWGIAVDNDRNVYVTDTLNNRIQKFSPYNP
jgi:tripartite motif-containing protein 71